MGVTCKLAKLADRQGTNGVTRLRLLAGHCHGVSEIVQFVR